ncbi:patatin-like phospholipase family protein [Microbulbifer sp. CnH-101-E]|uniref:patatin-like phospholipase family protein n=1 Tax=unclassified Microbulbifer TaxID=2619833 RepID=UPI0040398A18
MLKLAGQLTKKLFFTLTALSGAYALTAYIYNKCFPQSVTFNREFISKRFVRNLDHLQDKDTIKVLIITGGGVRGLIPLYVLQYIEKNLGKPINEVFDVFAGVSTGAFITT